MFDFRYLPGLAGWPCNGWPESGLNVWAWEPERHGCYSVESAYRLLDEARIGEAVGLEADGSGSSVWGKIWKLQIPPKVKVFWWRVIHEFLPSR